MDDYDDSMDNSTVDGITGVVGSTASAVSQVVLATRGVSNVPVPSVGPVIVKSSSKINVNMLLIIGVVVVGFVLINR